MTENQTTPHKTTNNKPPHLDDEITKKKPRYMWKTIILIEIERKRWRGGVISGQKLTQNQPSMKKLEEKT